MFNRDLKPTLLIKDFRTVLRTRPSEISARQVIEKTLLPLQDTRQVIPSLTGLLRMTNELHTEHIDLNTTINLLKKDCTFPIL